MQREQAIDRFKSVFRSETLPEVPDVKIMAVVLSYNEAVRLPHFIEHHAAIGVGHFIVVDNGSTDETAQMLDADKRVTRVYTTELYSENKAAWREVLADLYCTGRWVLFIDVDELLIYPGWPDNSLTRYCALLESRHEDALFTTMVDMYPDEPLPHVQYEPGTPFIETAPYFDTGNYRLIPLEPKAQKLWPTPHYRVFGGTRERVFSETEDNQSGLLENAVAKLVFSLRRRNLRPGKRRQKIDARARAFIGDGKQKLSPPNMSKVPLLRWRAGTQFPGGPHRVNKAYQMSDDWGALLHFKYFDDFAPRSKEAVERGQHAADAAHYKLYVGGLGKVEDKSLIFAGSKYFSSPRDLISAGLMRVSVATGKALATK